MNKYFVSFVYNDINQGLIFGNVMVGAVEYSAETKPEKFLAEVRENLEKDGNPNAVVLYWKLVF